MAFQSQICGEQFSSLYNRVCVSLITGTWLSMIQFLPEAKTAADTENDNPQKTREARGEEAKLKVGFEFERKYGFRGDGRQMCLEEGGIWARRHRKMARARRTEGVEAAAAITQSRHVRRDAPQTPVKELVDRMH